MNNLISYLGILPKWFYITYIALFGLCCGSFLNVVILRGLSGESFVNGRSHCPKCLNQLAWYMNIPLLSYLFLRGKCAFCHTKISLQYPIVELLTAILFVFSYLKLGFNFDFFFSLAFLFFSLALLVTDLKEKVIIDYHAYSLAVFGLLYSLLPSSPLNLWLSFLGAVSGFLILEIISKISVMFLSQRAFGEGDSLITLAFGSILGATKLLVLIPFAIFIQVILSIPLLLFDTIKKKKIKLALSYILVLISIVLLVLNKLLNLIEDESNYLIFALVVSTVLIWSLINVVKELKEKRMRFEENNITDEYDDKNPYTLLPFGPALVISFFAVFYFYDELVQMIKMFLF